MTRTADALLQGYVKGKQVAEEALRSSYPTGGVALRPGVIYGNRVVSSSITLPLQVRGGAGCAGSPWGQAALEDGHSGCGPGSGGLAGLGKDWRQPNRWNRPADTCAHDGHRLTDHVCVGSGHAASLCAVGMAVFSCQGGAFEDGH